MTSCNLISVDRIHELYRAGTSMSVHGLKPGCVEGAIGSAITGAMYSSPSDEPDPLRVAAHLLRSLARNHCFLDGNKRIAWLSCLEVLAVGADVTIEEDQAVTAQFVEAVATGGKDIPYIVGWLSERLVELPD